ncbi:MAG: hypothetical protein LUF01_07225 [Bacteroides sp.]|nr:hypothetical protein [Bacteroides sp.]
MKKILSLAIVLMCTLLSVKLWAQVEAGSPYKIWTDPVVYRASDQVTWYFDMTDTKFKAGEDLYLWSWVPSEPDAGNWDNSSDFAKLTYVGDNVYAMTMIPEKYYGVPAADMNANDDIFWGRLKTKTGDAQSDVFQVYSSHAEWTTFTESGEAWKSFPEKFGLKDPFSLLVDINKLVFAGKAGGLNDISWESLHFHSGLDDWSVSQEAQMWLPEIVEKTKLTHVEGSIYRMDLTPMQYYGVESDYEAENIAWLITTHNPDWAGTSPDAVLKAAAAAPYPDPAFSFFPQKFSALDILTLTRQYNGKTDGDLTYTLTAGEKTITGMLIGNRDKREAVINLEKELAGMTSLTKIHLTITNSNDVTVVDTDLPLVPLSEITYE